MLQIRHRNEYWCLSITGDGIEQAESAEKKEEVEVGKAEFFNKFWHHSLLFSDDISMQHYVKYAVWFSNEFLVSSCGKLACSYVSWTHAACPNGREILTDKSIVSLSLSRALKWMVLLLCKITTSWDMTLALLVMLGTSWNMTLALLVMLGVESEILEL